MASPRAFQLAARLATITAALMFGLIVVGSVVRTTGSGLSCPDWPLCHGRLIPPFQFNVFMEWFHRLIALLVGVLLLATAAAIAAHGARRARGSGGLAALAVALYFAQALLGALTVWKLLDPSMVSGHLAVGTAAVHDAAHDRAARPPRARAPALARRPRGPQGLLPLFGAATLLASAQAVLGGMVSTNHAGLACPDWPTCNGEWFPPMNGLVGLQMTHRCGAYACSRAHVRGCRAASGRAARPAARTTGRAGARAGAGADRHRRRERAARRSRCGFRRCTSRTRRSSWRCIGDRDVPPGRAAGRASRALAGGRGPMSVAHRRRHGAAPRCARGSS